MKVGDLVRFRITHRSKALQHLIGVIVDLKVINAPLVLWSNGKTMAEPPELLEVVNENK